MSDGINMNWQSDSYTVYALNEQGVNDFSFRVEGNFRNGHDPKTLQKVVSMAEAAPDMYRALREAVEDLNEVGCLQDKTLVKIDSALAKADGEQYD